MDEIIEIQVNIDITGKGTIQNKTMKVNGSDIKIEGIGGAWFWIRQEGCFKMEDTVYHTGSYDPGKDVMCRIISANGSTLSELSHPRLSLNNLKFEKYGSQNVVQEQALQEPENPSMETNGEAQQKIAALESEVRRLEGDVERLSLELDETKQRLENLSAERKDRKNVVLKLKTELESTVQQSERQGEAYRNQIEELNRQSEHLKNEYELTVQTYEKTLVERRKTFANVNKWMSRLSGMTENEKPNEKAAKIEQLVLERWNLLDENKRLRELIKEAGKKQVASSGDAKKVDGAAARGEGNSAKELTNAFKYVVVSIHMACQGEVQKTLDRLDRVLNGYHVIDPKSEGLTEKSLLVVRDYFEETLNKHRSDGLHDIGAMVNFFKDNIEKILVLPGFSNPHERVTLRQQLREIYDNYIPKSTR